MLENDELQLLAERKYAVLKQAVESAGFFAPQVIAEQDAEWIVCASRLQEDYGYTGRIAFVTEASGCWYLATPHPYHYRILHPERVEQALIAFLGRKDEAQGQLVQISHEEYEQALGNRAS